MRTEVFPTMNMSSSGKFYAVMIRKEKQLIFTLAKLLLSEDGLAAFLWGKLAKHL
jgi:hypothetical protein